MGSAGHSRALWAVTTLVVIGYSYLLATVLPFFSELVSGENPADIISMLRVLCPDAVHNLLVAAAVRAALPLHAAEAGRIGELLPETQRRCSSSSTYMPACKALFLGQARLSGGAQVGLVTSVTYLTVAYTLPSAFCLKLLRRKQPRWENALQVLWSLSGPCCSPKCCFLA